MISRKMGKATEILFQRTKLFPVLLSSDRLQLIKTNGCNSMVQMSVELRSVDGTQAAMGWAGGHTIVVDRPEGKAGGLGLGFNGAELLAFAIGGCFCNDLRYTAEITGAKLGTIAVTVAVELSGDPLLMTGATMTVACEMLDGSDAQDLIARTTATTMVTNSIRSGVPVTIQEAVSGLTGFV